MQPTNESAISDGRILRNSSEILNPCIFLNSYRFTTGKAGFTGENIEAGINKLVRNKSGEVTFSNAVIRHSSFV
jgi:hypothetical protein